MPIREYTCTKCDELIERIILTEAEDCETIVEQCKCGNNIFQKIISVSSFKLKGSGWEADGYSKPDK